MTATKAASNQRYRLPSELSRTRRFRVVQCLERLRANEPEPRCELVYHSPYQLLVSVVLSAQTTDKSVNRCMAPLYAAQFTPDVVLAHGEAWLLSQIRSIGLAPTKAQRVIALTRLIKERFGGEVPCDRAALEALPGVGHKTASVVLGEIFREPTLAIDTHVLRVTKRLGLHDANRPDQCEATLLTLIDPSYLPMAHHWFVLHGRYTCKAIKPACDTCLLADLCPSFGKVDVKGQRSKVKGQRR